MPVTDNLAEQILAYLRERMPRYPFKSDVDQAFVEELLDDFKDVAVLNEIKTYRWYYADQLPSHPRVAIRRWLARAPRRLPARRS